MMSVMRWWVIRMPAAVCLLWMGCVQGQEARSIRFESVRAVCPEYGTISTNMAAVGTGWRLEFTPLQGWKVSTLPAQGRVRLESGKHSAYLRMQLPGGTPDAEMESVRSAVPSGPTAEAGSPVTSAQNQRADPWSGWRGAVLQRYPKAAIQNERVVYGQGLTGRLLSLRFEAVPGVVNFAQSIAFPTSIGAIVLDLTSTSGDPKVEAELLALVNSMVLTVN